MVLGQSPGLPTCISYRCLILIIIYLLPKKKMVLGELDIHMEKNVTGPLSYTIHENHLKINDLNLRPETAKPLEKKSQGESP